MNELKEKLKFTECPSNWCLREIDNRKPASFIIDRLYEKEEEIAEPWSQLCITLTIAYLHSEKGDFTKAITVLKECDETLATSGSDLVVKYRLAFETVLNASRAVFLTMISTPSEVKLFADKIVQVRDLKDANEAAIYAIKSCVFSEFGVSGSTIALEHANKALKINPQEAHWHFLLGKLIGRIRHFSRDHVITPAEISHLQTAFSISQKPYAAIFLANAYIEKNRSLQNDSYKKVGRCDMQTKNKIKELTSESKKLIQFALDKNQNQCVHINIRCAFALTRLPRYDRDYDKAKQLIAESLVKSPCNPMANKIAGDLCLQEEKPMYHKALKHFEIAASKNVYSAYTTLFDIKAKLNISCDAEKFYSELLEKFSEKSYQILTLTHATTYYLFIMRDLCTAVDYFIKAINLDNNFHTLSETWVRYINKTVNLFEVIGNEARYAINNQLYNSTNQLQILKNVITLISESKPDIMKIPIVPNQVQKYLDLFENEKKNMSGSGRGRGGGRGRGRGGDRGRGRGGDRGRGRGGRGREDSTDLSRQNSNDFSKNQNFSKSNQIGREKNTNFGTRNRSLSRNRNEQKIKEGNNNQTELDKMLLSYSGNKAEEVITNPYFAKFLDLKYKNLTKADSFKDFLQEYNGDFENSASNKPKIESNNDERFQELIMEIRNLKLEINNIKSSDSRSCFSLESNRRHHRDRCHSLKSLEYCEGGKIRKSEQHSDRSERNRKKYMNDSLQNRNFDKSEIYFTRRERRREKDGYRWAPEDRGDRYHVGGHRSPSFREREKYRQYCIEDKSYSSSTDSSSESSCHNRRSKERISSRYIDSADAIYHRHDKNIVSKKENEKKHSDYRQIIRNSNSNKEKKYVSKHSKKIRSSPSSNSSSPDDKKKNRSRKSSLNSTISDSSERNFYSKIENRNPEKNKESKSNRQSKEHKYGTIESKSEGKSVSKKSHATKGSLSEDRYKESKVDKYCYEKPEIKSTTRKPVEFSKRYADGRLLHDVNSSSQSDEEIKYARRDSDYKASIRPERLEKTGGKTNQQSIQKSSSIEAVMMKGKDGNRYLRNRDISLSMDRKERSSSKTDAKKSEMVLNVPKNTDRKSSLYDATSPSSSEDDYNIIRKKGVIETGKDSSTHGYKNESGCDKSSDRDKNRRLRSLSLEETSSG